MLSYDKIAEFYDEDMGRNSVGKDIVFYTQQCRTAHTPILELGCGTGRISLPLAKAGKGVVGIDTSLPMLKQLQRKKNEQLSIEERMRLRYCQMDMSGFAFNIFFEFILCPFSAFFYLTNKALQIKTLNAIRSHLTPNGRFILDVFVPDQRMETLPNNHVFYDYERTLPDGRVLKRTKTIQKTAVPNVNLITRNYYFEGHATALAQKITTTHLIHYHFPDQLNKLLQENGFKVLITLSDFQNRPHGDKTHTVAMICKAH